MRNAVQLRCAFLWARPPSLIARRNSARLFHCLASNDHQNRSGISRNGVGTARMGGFLPVCLGQGCAVTGHSAGLAASCLSAFEYGTE
jgi:hypothetical protein